MKKKVSSKLQTTSIIRMFVVVFFVMISLFLFLATKLGAFGDSELYAQIFVALFSIFLIWFVWLYLKFVD